LTKSPPAITVFEENSTAGKLNGENKMKKIMLVLLLVSAAFPAYGAEDSTLMKRIQHHGAFLAPVLKATEFRNQLALLVGGRVAWVANHQFCLGVGGYGLASEVESDYFGPDSTFLLNFGYGGLEVEYIFYPRRIFHFTVYSLIGAGGASFFTRDPDIDVEWDGDVFFIVEPGVNLELNVRDGFRIDFGYSYRFVSNLRMEGLSNKDLRDVAAVLTLRMGKF
jgi:hypothetical protein